MRNVLITGLTALALCLPTTRASAQLLEASFSFVSDPDDYIGGGQSRSFTLDTASITIRGDQDGRYVAVTLFPFEDGFLVLQCCGTPGNAARPRRLRGRDALALSKPDTTRP